MEHVTYFFRMWAIAFGAVAFVILFIGFFLRLYSYSLWPSPSSSDIPELSNVAKLSNVTKEKIAFAVKTYRRTARGYLPDLVAVFIFSIFGATGSTIQKALGFGEPWILIGGSCAGSYFAAKSAIAVYYRQLTELIRSESEQPNNTADSTR